MLRVNRVVMLVGTLAVAAALAGCGAVGPAASGGTTNTISVSGYGEATAAPDIAYIGLGVDVADENVGTAVESSNATVQRIIDALKEAGVDEKDIQTTNFNVWQEDRYDPATGQPTGVKIYHVNNTLTVKVRDISLVSDIIDKGLAAGANQVNSLSFGIEETRPLETEARAAAIEDARARAEEMAAALGVRLGNVVYVSDSTGYGQPVLRSDVASAAAGGMGGGAGAPPISEGQLVVGVTVSISYEILR
ncbi:MAG: SIMPL domain-containing protein [Anaerolineae bacterium]|nr:SIMPL domain-containing protein [Anaerolineae bacterium]